MTVQQRVPFRVYFMECCGCLVCNVNARHHTYCPNCGRMVYPAIRGWVTYVDEDAVLRSRDDVQ